MCHWGDAHAIAVTSYQGGHIEFFKYMFDMLKEAGCGHIKIFGGGGGTILPAEIEELHQYGIERIYSPDDGRQMGLEGMIEDVMRRCLPEEGASDNSCYFKAVINGTTGCRLAKSRHPAYCKAITLAEKKVIIRRYSTILSGTTIYQDPGSGIGHHRNRRSR